MDLRGFQGEDPATLAAEEFAVHIHNEWGIGNPSPCGDTGLLFFLSLHDRAMYFSRGKGLEKVFTNRRLDRIMNDVKPSLREGDYVGALSIAFQMIESFLEKGEATTNEIMWEWLESFFPFGMIAGLFGFSFWQGHRQRRAQRQYAQVESQLTQLDRNRAEALQGRYNCTSCPICFGDFETTDDGSPPKIGSDGKPLKLLRCGHVFDQTCWDEWVTSGSGNVRRCPVCQQDVGEPVASDGQGQPLMEDANVRNNDEIVRRDRAIRRFQRDRNFRLARLGQRYPRFINPHQIREWTSTTHNGPLARDPTFVNNNPSRYNPSEQRSSSSSRRTGRSSSSFGGGRSSGGRAGRW